MVGVEVDAEEDWQAESAVVDVVVSGRSRDAEFVAFVAEHGATLRRIATLLSGDPHRAEELLQATLERTYRAWGRARDGDPMAYSRRILANLRIDTWRRTRRELLLTQDQLPDHGESDRSTEIVLRDELTWRFAHFRSSSGAWSCCATCSTCQRPRSPPSSGSPAAR